MGTPRNLISFTEYTDMLNSFVGNIEDKLGSNLTKSVWFSLENLEEYIAYIKNNAKENNIDISGIRFHMVAQDQEKKQLTLALVPTYENNDKHIDFDPVLSDKDKKVTLESLKTDAQKAVATGAILNRGDLCPPKCPT